MPGYEPFLLCDFHVHMTWSDGRLSVREVVDLHGQTGRFDVIALTDHILMKRDLLLRVGRMASLGLRHFSVTEERFGDYMADLAREARRPRRLYDLLVIPGAEVTQNHIRSKKNSHVVALDLREFISADQPAEDIYSWKTLLRCEKNWESIARTLRANVDVALTLYRKGSWAA